MVGNYKKSPLLLGIILLLVGLLVFALQAFKYYKLCHSLRNDPSGINKVVFDPSLPYLSLGSSTIHRWPFSKNKLLKNQINNCGIEGQTSGQIVLRARVMLETYNPKVVIIHMGINDIKSTIFLKEETVITQLISNYETLLDLCIKTGVRPIVITNFQRGHKGTLRRLFWSKKQDRMIVKVNKDLIVYCKSRNIDFVDAHCLFKGRQRFIRSKLYTQDFFHLNSLGYEILNEHVSKILKNYN